MHRNGFTLYFNYSREYWNFLRSTSLKRSNSFESKALAFNYLVSTSSGMSKCIALRTYKIH